MLDWSHACHCVQVASIAAGAGAHRVSGVAPHAKIMCLKVQDDNGNIFASYVFGAFQYAQAMGAHIISNSFSNTYWDLPSEPSGMRSLMLHYWAAEAVLML